MEYSKECDGQIILTIIQSSPEDHDWFSGGCFHILKMLISKRAFLIEMAHFEISIYTVAGLKSQLNLQMCV